MRILITEDNRRLSETLRDILKSLRFEADIADNGTDGYALANSGLYDGMILDVMLPGMDGITLLREIRRRGNGVPVLMLTAKSETEDKVLGLSAGADYYLTKPFDKDELSAALRAILRRGGELRPDVLSFGDLRLDQTSFCLSCGEKSLRLGKKEFEVMRILLANKNAVVSKETLLLKIWGSDGEAMDNNVEIYISFLRKKLAFLHTNVRILTARHLGYYLSENEMRES